MVFGILVPCTKDQLSTRQHNKISCERNLAVTFLFSSYKELWGN